MSKCSGIKILYRARQLITNKRNWLDGRYCNRPSGLLPLTNATRFCAVAAIDRATLELFPHRGPGKKLFSERTINRIMDINDGKGHAAVLKHLDRMTEAAQ